MVLRRAITFILFTKAGVTLDKRFEYHFQHRQEDTSWHSSRTLKAVGSTSMLTRKYTQKPAHLKKVINNKKIVISAGVYPP